MRFFDARICVFIRTRFEFVADLFVALYHAPIRIRIYLWNHMCVLAVLSLQYYWLYVCDAMVCKRLHMSHVFALFAPTQYYFFHSCAICLLIARYMHVHNILSTKHSFICMHFCVFIVAM